MFKKHEFNVESFYLLGEWLSTQNPDIKNCSGIKEGIYRTIISRYYYYVFLKIRNTILAYDSNNMERLHGSSTHTLIVSYLNALDDILGLDGELGLVADSLAKLRNLRNNADYDTNGREITLDDVCRAKVWVDNIVSSLKNIKFDNIIGFENILNHIRINRGYSSGLRFPKLKWDEKGRSFFE